MTIGRETSDGLVAEHKGFQRLEISHRGGEAREPVSLVAETAVVGGGEALDGDVVELKDFQRIKIVQRVRGTRRRRTWSPRRGGEGRGAIDMNEVVAGVSLKFCKNGWEYEPPPPGRAGSATQINAQRGRKA